MAKTLQVQYLQSDVDKTNSTRWERKKEKQKKKNPGKESEKKAEQKNFISDAGVNETLGLVAGFFSGLVDAASTASLMVDGLV